jgi:exoribonuclease-2
MANVAVARFCREQGIPVVYRTQEPADLSDLGEVENEVVRRRRVLRRMRPAQMSPEPDLHGGLGVELYCQASSPLRRYADLSVQRQIVSHLLGDPLPYDGEAIQSVLYQAEERMREITRLERRRERYWLTKYLTRFEGEQFEGVVLDARERAMNVEVLEYGLSVDVRPIRPVEPGETVTLRLGRCDPWADMITFLQVE